jgi:hypothetical protein
VSTPVAASTHAVVWIDHHHANIVRIDAGGAPPHRVKAHVHPTAQHGSEVRSAHEFFAEVCSSLDAVDAVLVTGARTALADFRHYVEKHRPQTTARVAAYDVVDHPTDNQLTALGRQFFEL